MTDELPSTGSSNQIRRQYLLNIKKDQSQQCPDLIEPMVYTAPLMDMLSIAVCGGDYVSGEDCSWYHSVWQYLRVFDLVSTPTWHPNFYIPQLKLASTVYENPKILISGTADYSTLAHVLFAFNANNVNFDITVLDLCQTPLIMCQWYAKQSKYQIKTLQADILTCDFGHLFDIIVTDAFLTRFPPLERKQVITRWFNILREKGRVITTVRINDINSPDKIIARPDQVEVFCSKVLQQAQRWQGLFPISPTEITEKARKYAENMISHSIHSLEEIKTDFMQVGFDLFFSEAVQVKGEMIPTEYLELTAVKP